MVENILSVLSLNRDMGNTYILYKTPLSFTDILWNHLILFWGVNFRGLWEFYLFLRCYWCVSFQLENLFIICFRKLKDVNLWVRVIHEYHENWAITNSNDSTILAPQLYTVMRTPLFVNTSSGREYLLILSHILRM